VLEKDSGEISKFASHAAMQSYLERIDIDNNEYSARDAAGHPLTLLVEEPVWPKPIRAPEPAGAPNPSDSWRRFAHLREASLKNQELALAALALYEAIILKRGEPGASCMRVVGG
jgi:hypothetical protein